MSKRAYKIFLAVFMLAITLFVFAPVALYSYSLSLVGDMPQKTVTHLDGEEFETLWKTHETCSTAQCASITPYWIYRWIAEAFINDYVAPIDRSFLYRNVSIMASQVAIYHMRHGHFTGKGMGWWHITHLNLSIWIQRNWNADEIAAKYKAITVSYNRHEMKEIHDVA